MRRAPLRAVIAGALTASLVAAGVVAITSASADTAPRRIVSGWLPYWSMSSSMNSVAQSADLWAEASPFWFQATGATTITRHTGAGDPTVINDLRGRGIKVVPTVTESLNSTAMAALLTNPTQRGAHVTTLVDLVTAGGYDGIDLDYESMNFGGTATDKASVRSGFVTLVRDLAAALRAKGKLLSVTVGPRTRADDPNWAVFDYAGIAPSADRFRIMTYEYHWSGGSPGAVAPVWWVDRVLAYAVTAVPANKIEVGVPLYGYDWAADPTQPDGYGTGDSKTYQEAEALRTQYGAVRQWSSSEGAPYFSYTANGVNHVVWYNDADATKAKMTFIEKYGVRGLVFWAVGSEDSRQWPDLRSYAIQKSTQLTVSAPTLIMRGTSATVSGVLSTTGGAPVPGQKVTLQWRPPTSSTWGDVATGTTSSTGAVSLGYAPSVSGYFRLYAPSSWSYLPATSPVVQTVVQLSVYGPRPGRVPPSRVGGSLGPIRPVPQSRGGGS